MFPTIQNIVSTINLGCEIDLHMLSRKVDNIEYSPRKWAPAAIMRIRNPRTTALIFKSGKLVCTGAANVTNSRKSARRFARLCQKAGFPVCVKDFKIQNIVASCNLKFTIDLRKLYDTYRDLCSYCPESFPGLKFSINNSALVALIFTSGKIVITGAKIIDDISQSFNQLYPILIDFKKIKR